MPRRGHTEEQILQALRQTESGAKAGEVCRRMGISEQTFYTWKRKYAGLGLSELRELRQLREENTKLKRLVADLSLDRHMLQAADQIASSVGTMRAQRVALLSNSQDQETGDEAI